MSPVPPPDRVEPPPAHRRQSESPPRAGKPRQRHPGLQINLNFYGSSQTRGTRVCQGALLRASAPYNEVAAGATRVIPTRVNDAR